ncbi:MAG: DUF1592 domain-containing protein [Planctomycetales bacterium]|nr:DUF1592 domain-containing protein [Planctomycetales bacterium]
MRDVGRERLEQRHFQLGSTSMFRLGFFPRRSRPDSRTSVAAFSCACCFMLAYGIGVNAQETLPRPLAELLDEHCVECHDSGSDLPLFSQTSHWDSTGATLADVSVQARWLKALERVERAQMPPADSSTLGERERADFVRALETSIIEQQNAYRSLNGRTPQRRLTRGEFERTVQDLLAISLPLQPLLPEESREGGYDRVARGLRFSPLHVDQWLVAVDAALDEALQFGPRPNTDPQRFTYRDERGIRSNLTSDHPVVRDLGDSVAIFTDAAYITRLHAMHFEVPGMYRFRIRAKAFQANRPVVLQFHLGNWSKGSTRMVGYWDVLPDEYQTFEVIARVENNEYCYPAPDQLMAASPDSNIWNTAAERYAGEGLAIEWIEVEGPLQESWPPESVRRVLGDVALEPLERERWEQGRRIGYEAVVDDPHGTAEASLRHFAERAFRRPVDSDELTPFLELAHDALENGARYEDAMRRAVRAMLVSPQFLLHHEPLGRLDDHALANRLSYFLWGTLPDEELLEVARSGRLGDDQVLRAQTERLLGDPRSRVMVNAFVDQWLDVGRIDATTPDGRLYPEFDELLKQSMIEESRAFLAELLTHDRPLRLIVDSDFVMGNRRLAEHYDLPPIVGQEVRPIELPADSPRGGILTQAAILKVTANGTVSSPVTRGVWVQSRLLGQPTPAPPASVGAIEPDTRGATTIREQLDAHRRVPSCAACHRSFDPLGFPLESFDVIGGYRSRYRSTVQGERPEYLLRGRPIWEYKIGPEVDSSTVMDDGTSVADAADLKRWLLTREPEIARHFVSQWMTYATGHEVERADHAEIDSIIAAEQADDFRVRGLLHAIVQSRLFREK